MRSSQARGSWILAHTRVNVTSVSCARTRSAFQIPILVLYYIYTALHDNKYPNTPHTPIYTLTSDKSSSSYH